MSLDILVKNVALWGTAGLSDIEIANGRFVSIGNSSAPSNARLTLDAEGRMACGEEDSLSPAPALLYNCRSEHHDVFVYQSGTTRYLTFEPGASACNQTAIDVEDPRYLVGDYRHALTPWLELHKRNLLDAAVQESYLAGKATAVEVVQEHRV